MAKPGRNIYPDISGIRNLPIFLAGVGGTADQTKITREKGLQWNQIIRCGEGSGTAYVGGNRFSLHENDFILIPAETPYDLVPETEKWETNWVAFGGSACERLLEDLNLSKPTVITVTDNTIPRGLFTTIYVSVNSDHVFGHQIASGYVYNLILWYRQTILLGEMNRLRKNSQQILSMAIRYIEENARRDITLREIAEHVGISQQHICRIFRDHLNVHSTEYITRIRLNLAMEMILNTNLPMSEVAKECGFRSASYFSTVFGKYEHMTPNEYRKRYRV